MRKLVWLVIGLVGLKLGYQEYVYRAATREVIVGLVQERALQHCQRHARTTIVTPAGSPQSGAWTRPQSIALRIGKANGDVQFWQISHPQWNARYRNPYLLIVPEGAAANLACEYDILNGTASVHRT